MKTKFISPIGDLYIKKSGDKKYNLSFFNKERVSVANANDPIIIQINEYFAGKRLKFDLEIMPDGTNFQKQVWQALCDIPFGQTMTYKQIANKIGRPKAARAVGLACNKNPLAIIIPCHRVVGSNRNLTGYAGGLEKKQWLLQFENAI